MRVLVIDEDATILKQAKEILESSGQFDVVALVTGGFEAIRGADEYAPDLILVQCDMSGMNGIETVRHFCRLEAPPAVVFLLDMEVDLSRLIVMARLPYTVKPLVLEHLMQAVDSALKFDSTDVKKSLEFRPQSWRDGAKRRVYIEVGDKGNTERIPVDDIQLFDASNKYTELHTFGRVFEINESLRDLAAEFSGDFLWHPRNYLISTTYLKGISHTPEGRFQIVIEGLDEGVEIGRRHVATLRKYIQRREEEREHIH